uniref:Carboxylic ester hydrolase n=1 Tax=Tetraodon nigroviridis TaxID=99883 RepID=H3CMY0_TETNG
LQFQKVTLGWHRAIIFLLPFVLFVASADGNDLLVTIKNGIVQGKLLPVLNGSVGAFLGIPYAKPPVGKLRFRNPEPVDSWEGVKNASSFSNTCFQLADTTFPGFRGAEMWNPNTPVSEDCLYLNVWTPRVNNSQASSALPVMIWIYGGGFTTGTASLDLYDGRYLSKSEDVIVVSMNYRVGVLGFLSLPNNTNVRGNAGLMDQRLAIQWVVDNIAAFGGDPSQITLFGESAGSVCVGLHVLSPGSNVLFKRAVMESGAPTATWSTANISESKFRSTKLGMLVGCSNISSDLETCLQNTDATGLLKVQYGVLSNPSTSDIPFLPVVDGVFLPDEIDALISNPSIQKKEVLLGLNHDEGTYFLVYTVPGFDITSQSPITKAQFLTGVNLIFSHSYNITKETITFQYTDWADEENGTKNRDALNRMLSNYMFICPVQDFAYRYQQAGGKPFLYYFQHRSSRNPWPEWMGVMHGYEIEFVFGLPLNPSLGYTQEEVNMSKRFMKYWATFARTGNPGIDGQPWPMFTSQNKEYVTLDTQAPNYKTKLRANDCQFWNSLIPQITKMAGFFRDIQSKYLCQKRHQKQNWLCDTNQLISHMSAKKENCCDF